MNPSFETQLAHTTALWLANTHYFAVLHGILFIFSFWLGGAMLWWHTILSMILFYLHIRLSFDRAIFTAFATQQLNPETFDQCRLALTLGQANPSRSMQARCHGAMRLWWIMMWLTLLQWLCVIAQWI